MIHLDRVRRQFGPRVVFDGLSWQVPARARLGLVGPNGAGKTTLLRLLAGLDEPDAGEVRRIGRPRVAYLPQEVEAVPDGTVLRLVLDGLPEVRSLEGELAGLEARLAGMDADDPELAPLTAAYGEARQRYEVLGGHGVEARARAILGGLGVETGRFGDPVHRLSGGWRMRVLLARMLLSAPDLLLLDEPTNHLDLEAIAWLEEFLGSFPGAFLVVSHDRYFLNRMVRGIVEMDAGALTPFAGDYDAYLEERERRHEAQQKAARQQARDLARAERFIERFRYKASKARQVQSRLKSLARVEKVTAPRTRRAMRFGFPTAPRSGEVAARGEEISVAFGERTVYQEASFVLRRGDRVALVGPNGSGKSTLLRLLAGSLVPRQGELLLGHNVIPRHYAQHQLEALNPDLTVLEQIEAAAEPGLRPRLRTILGAMLFPGTEVEKKVAALSGGERARLALACLLVRPANLLLLDEPTNHLDLPSREVLEGALLDYDGTLVVVSHDRYFINRVATSIGEVGGGKIRIVPGDYDSWRERQGTEDGAATSGAGEASAGDPARRSRHGERATRRAEAEERNRRSRERRTMEKRLAPLEAAIDDLEERLRALTAAQADPAVYATPSRARRVAREKAEAEAELQDLYRRWEAAAEQG